jgi:hypothetical protein
VADTQINPKAVAPKEAIAAPCSGCVIPQILIRIQTLYQKLKQMLTIKTDTIFLASNFDNP